MSKELGQASEKQKNIIVRVVEGDNSVIAIAVAGLLVSSSVVLSRASSLPTPEFIGGIMFSTFCIATILGIKGPGDYGK